MDGAADGASEVRWARRIRPDVIRRLYTLDAKGIVDEELINEVGYAMLARCESIRTATRAHFGRGRCPRCRSEVRRAGEDMRRWRKDEAMACGCGWATTWGAYHKTYRGKQLVGGNAYPMFRAFIERWPEARTTRDKMLAIDAMIHAVHGEFKGSMSRPAACNLIEGTATELARFLDELAYGEKSTQGIAEARREWDERVGQSWPWRKWRGEADGGAGGAPERD